ncbi:MAG: hypothetical protein ACXVCY_12380 [Pseudobdellovibrionaceae bacterium]
MVKHIFLIFLIVLSISIGHAGPYKPLKELVTYSEFVDLLKDSVSRIPDLQEYWKWQKKGNYPVFVGGGVIRGLMHWLYIQLQTNDIATIKKMKIPTIDELQLQEGSDVDLFAPDNLIEKMEKQLPQYAEWDILPDSFYVNNIKLGGPTIEKFRVNPDVLEDPLDGVKHYYDGRLVFYWTPENIFRKLYWVAKRGNTKTTEALRFVRFLYNLPELSSDSQSIELISTISTLEIPLITKSQDNNWWLKKGLNKLFWATKSDLVETLDALRQFKLLRVLSYHQYKIEGSFELWKYAHRLKARGFSMSELKGVERMMQPSVNDSEKFLTELLPYVKSADEFITLASSTVKEPSFTYASMMQQWFKKNKNYFFKFKPTSQEIKTLSERVYMSSAMVFELYDSALPLLKNGDEFLTFIDFAGEEKSDLFKRSFHNWIYKNQEKVFQWKLSESQFDKLVSYLPEGFSKNQFIKKAKEFNSEQSSGTNRGFIVAPSCEGIFSL